MPGPAGPDPAVTRATGRPAQPPADRRGIACRAGLPRRAGGFVGPGHAHEEKNPRPAPAAVVLQSIAQSIAGRSISPETLTISAGLYLPRY